MRFRALFAKLNAHQGTLRFRALSYLGNSNALQAYTMRGLMQDKQLLISDIIEYAAKWHKEQKIVTQLTEGGLHTYTYADCLRRSKLAALAVQRLGVRPGDRLATMAWNNHRHLELWYGPMGTGAVVHTLNPRLFPADLEYIANHASDRVLFFDLTFLKLIRELRSRLKTVKRFVIMTDRAHMPADASKDGWLCYEDLLAAEESILASFRWPALDENTACGMCYTSGTTGRPKGVVYSHRSNFLQALVESQPDAINTSANSTILPIVPMFHANSWGLVFCAPLVGASLILPGPQLDGASLYKLIAEHRVTHTAAVPTVCAGLLQYCADHGRRLESLHTVVIGGAATPASMIRKFQSDHGITVRCLWGMTETSPIGTVGGLKASMAALPDEEKAKMIEKAGRPHILVDMRTVLDDGRICLHDGKTSGSLQVRGPQVLKAYYKHDGDHGVDKDGWFSTGDIATIDPLGHMQITDRSKDVIKSGGEWISSIDVENEATACPGVQEAAVIGIPHPKWTERPLLIVVRSKGSTVSKKEVLHFLQGKVAKWWIPEDCVFVEEIPHTAAGKISKLQLRQKFKKYESPKSKL